MTHTHCDLCNTVLWGTKNPNATVPIDGLTRYKVEFTVKDHGVPVDVCIDCMINLLHERRREQL